MTVNSCTSLRTRDAALCEPVKARRSEVANNSGEKSPDTHKCCMNREEFTLLMLYYNIG